MAIIYSYPKNTDILVTDTIVGTSTRVVNGRRKNVTKNFEIGAIATFFNENSSIAITGQNNFFFQNNIAPGRKPGSISFVSGGGTNTPFGNITLLRISKFATSGNDVSEYIKTLATQALIIAQTDNLNNFGIYECLDILPATGNPNFLDLQLRVLNSNGAIMDDLFYGFAVYPGFVNPDIDPVDYTFEYPLLVDDRTVSIEQSTSTEDGYLSSSDWNTFNDKQNTLTLTTTGDSGPATLIADVLNIPEYSTDLSGYVPYTGATSNLDLGTYTLLSGKFLTGPSASANFTRFPNALAVISNIPSGAQHNESLYIGLMSEGTSVGNTWGSGIYGAGYTNSTGTGRGTGVTGEGHVSAAADTGVAVGVRGYAKDVHTGNYNIGLYGDAENGDAGLTYGGNVSLFLANGNIVTSSAAPKTWYLGGNLTFDGQGTAKTVSFTNGATLAFPALTNGSVLFSNGTTIAQDNANFFWDDTNNRLGIGTNTPATTIDVNGTIKANIFRGDSLNNNANTVTLIQFSGTGNRLFDSSGNQVANIRNNNFGIGAGTAIPGARLDVRAQGALSTDIAFKVRNSADTADLMSVNGAGGIGLFGLTSINGAGVANTALAISGNGNGAGNFLFRMYDASAVERFQLTASGNLTLTGATDNATTGDDNKVRMFFNFSPTSGTRSHTGITLGQTINQTGGANGITRGLYINPTLTSAFDFRAIETTAGNVIFNGGNVGIGTTTTRATLDVVNTPSTTLGTNIQLRIGGGNNTSGHLYQIGLGASNQTNPSSIIGAINNTGSSFGNSDIFFATRNVTTDTVPSEKMRITSTGNVGIGTTSPTTKLSIVASSNGSAINTNALNLDNPGGAAAQSTSLLFTNGTNTGKTSIQSELLSGGVGANLYFNTSLTGGTLVNRMSILGNGNVGIGATSPGARLDVRAQGTLSNDIAFRVRNSADTDNLIFSDGRGLLTVKGVTTNQKISFALNDRVYVGLEVGLNIIGANNTNKLFLASESDLPIAAFSNGTVIIGQSTNPTSSPSAKLRIDSTTQGFLPPRMTNTERLAIASPAIGLMVYCTDAIEGLYINKSTGWTFII